MLLPVLITIIIILGIAFYYIFFLGPRLNPYNRAEAFASQDMIEEAILEYKKILDKNPYNFAVHFKLSELYSKQNQLDLAVKHLEEILNINRYNLEVEKIEVLRRLGRVYIAWDESARAFQAFIDLLKINPGDPEALYHVSFIALGQEYFELAQKHFEKLVLVMKKNFEVLFGAGISSYQNQKVNETVKYLKEALVLEPHSDIGNIAMGFAQLRRRDYRTGINYARMVVDSTEDPNALFIAKRLLGILFVLAKKGNEAVLVFEDLLDHVKKNEMTDEIAMILYDLGFACLRSEKTDQAYEYWNQLYKMDRNYRDVQRLIMLLRKEMDEDTRSAGGDIGESIVDYIERWVQKSFPENFIYNICGLKSDKQIDLSSIVVTARVPMGRDSVAEGRDRSTFTPGEKIEAYSDLDIENFRIISNRVVSKLGYSVDEILPTYRENDGVDFMARSNQDKSRTLIWVRRWKGTNVGEIPLRNFAQGINDMKAKRGIFITTSELTESAESAVSKLSKVSVVYPEQLAVLLSDLI